MLQSYGVQILGTGTGTGTGRFLAEADYRRIVLESNLAQAIDRRALLTNWSSSRDGLY